MIKEQTTRVISKRNKVLRTLTDVQLKAILNKNSQTQVEKKAKLAKQRLKYALNERYYQD